MLDWFRLPWKNSTIDELASFEASLEAAFKPVEPRPAFVRDLRRRLITFPAPVTPAPDSQVPQYIALTIASLLSGVAIVGFGVWVILGLLSRLQSHDESVVTSPHSAL